MAASDSEMFIQNEPVSEAMVNLARRLQEQIGGEVHGVLALIPHTIRGKSSLVIIDSGEVAVFDDPKNMLKVINAISSRFHDSLKSSEDGEGEDWKKKF
jgi:hypothetical protein